MNKWILGLIFSVLSMTCVAQVPGIDTDTGTTGTAPKEDSITIKKENLKQLIETLESDTARKELVDNLKTLLEQTETEKEKKAEPIVPLADWLHLDENRESLVGKAFTKLSDMGMSNSAIGDLVLFVGSAIGLCVLAFANHRLARWFNRRLSNWRKRMHLPRDRFSSYFRLQVWFGYLFAFFSIIHLLTAIYHPWPALIAKYINIITIINSTVVILVVFLLFITVWEVSNAVMEIWVMRTRSLSRARVDTLKPIIRNVLSVILLVMLGLVMLSEFGVNIVPLMAGAGVLGIAVGFGAQTMIKDFIGGFLVIFEDLLQVGDVVGVGGSIGTVEKITMRKIQLRDVEGIVYTVPFGDITIVKNYTKLYSYALFDIGVAYRESVDEVIECLIALDKEFREVEEFKSMLLEPLEVLGVDKFADSAVIVRVRIKTRAHDKWRVFREFNRRIKNEFDKRGIDIPVPQRTLFFGQDKKGESPAANINLLNGRVGDDNEKEKQEEDGLEKN